MKHIDLIQRLQHNPDEAVIVYHEVFDDAAWIVNRQGIVQHNCAVDSAMIMALGADTVRWVASQVPSRAAIFRPASDFTEAHE